MARQWFVNGEAMVSVKGRTDSLIGSLTQLGLSTDAIRITVQTHYKDIQLDAWGGKATTETQSMLAEARVSMTLVHYDVNILNECIRLAMGFPAVEGEVARAGTLMGGNVARFVAGNNYIGLNISSPVGNMPWRFLYSYIMSDPVYPLGTEKSMVQLNWKALPFALDPWNGGLGALNSPLFDHTLDT